jgi:hypothetical protein
MRSAGEIFRYNVENDIPRAASTLERVFEVGLNEPLSILQTWAWLVSIVLASSD